MKMSDNEDNKSLDGDSSSKDGINKVIEQDLCDPAKKAHLLQQLGVGDSDENTSTQGGSRTLAGLGASYPNLLRSTLSEKSMSGNHKYAMFPPGSQTFPNLYFPYAQYGHHSGLARPWRKQPRITEEPDEEKESESQGQEDIVDLLSEGEASEFVEFDPKDSWKAPTISFIEKHFNRSLSDEEHKAIMKDFPRPRCDALTTLDRRV